MTDGETYYRVPKYRGSTTRKLHTQPECDYVFTDRKLQPVTVEQLGSEPDDDEICEVCRGIEPHEKRGEGDWGYQDKLKKMSPEDL